VFENFIAVRDGFDDGDRQLAKPLREVIAFGVLPVARTVRNLSEMKAGSGEVAFQWVGDVHQISIVPVRLESQSRSKNGASVALR
jgi:hypothetical protein